MCDSILDDSQPDFSLQCLVDDIIAVIKHAFPGERVHLLGSSMGGMLVQLVAAAAPDLLLSVILGCTAISVLNPIEPPVLSTSAADDFGQFLNADKKGATATATAAQKRALVAKLLASNYTPAWVQSRAAYYQYLIDHSMRCPRPLRATILQNLCISAFDGLKDYTKYAYLPTLIIHGEQDAVINVRQAYILADRLPNTELLILPGVGHLWWVQSVRQSAATIALFMSNAESINARWRIERIEKEKRMGIYQDAIHAPVASCALPAAHSFSNPTTCSASSSSSFSSSSSSAVRSRL